MESKINQIQKRIADPRYSARAALNELLSELNCSGENWTKRLSENAAILSESLRRRAHALLRRQLWAGAILCVAALIAVFLGTILAEWSVLRGSLEQQATAGTKNCVAQLLQEEKKLVTLQRQVVAELSRLDDLRVSVRSAETTLNRLNEQIKLRAAYPLPQFSDPATGQRYQFMAWPPEVRQTATEHTWAVAPIRPSD